MAIAQREAIAVTCAWEVPASWRWTAIGDVSTIIAGGTPKTSDPANFDGGEIPWITPADLSGYREKFIAHGARNITKKGLKSSSARMMPAGTVLFSSRAPIGYVAIASQPVTTNQGFKSFVLPDEIDPSYTYYYLQNSRELVESLSGGTTFKEISGANAARIPFAIAPLPEQRRIVAEIEKQFTRLDASVAALRRTQANLKRYRASVLRAACSGELVPTESEQARAEGREYEPADVLLERILVERRAHWDAQEKRRGKYKDPAAPDTSELPPLPEGWVWATVDACLSGIQAGKNFKCEERPPGEAEHGVVKVSSVTWGEFDSEESKTCHDLNKIEPRLMIKPGDFLFSRANTLQLVGACVIVRSVTRNLMLSDKILRFSVVQVPNEWLLCFLRSAFGRNEIERLATGNQESMRNIGQDRIRQIRLPLPPFAEQRRIVAEVERRLSVIQQAEVAVGASLQRAERLRQSILKRAFAGELVPQDPDDEPASVLLERIRAQREAEQAAATPSKKQSVRKRRAKASA